jgi:hypothetical protein
MVKKNTLTKWQNSYAKKLVHQDILDGKVVVSMMPKEVLAMRPEYEPYGKNFGTNLRNLQKAIRENQAKADSDSAALAHDRRVYPPSANTSQGCPRWDGSEAERLLRKDVDEGLTSTYQPKVLHQMRPEYQALALAVFREHIHQEKRSRLNRGYWLNKK